ncbi:nitrite reductase [Desulfovibrio mangrovi]|uniref:nitrite reductase n=1 Tax=Desulfovibrio mangrovi TaxID=2976983 RepID=UPI00224557A8|nr:nitrite reductase [Desulfovibrio mangrovi]UZP66689.1 nitrite reductase [Desulfovibrio mangrovi]
MHNTTTESVIVMPVERKDDTYALRLCLNQGLMTPGMLRRVLEVIEKYNLPSLRATTGQRMNLEGIPTDKLDEICDALGTRVEKCAPGATVCPGKGICKYGIQETADLGNAIVALVKKNGPYPFKIKSGVSGCKMSCGLSYVRDIGLVATAKGWDVLFGGCATRNAAPGVLIGESVSADEALKLLEKALIFYRENGKKRERTAATVARLGKEALLAAVKA